MKRYRILVLSLTLMSSSAVPARADGFFSPFLGFGFNSDSPICRSLTDCEEKRTQWGASFGSMNGVFGFEEDIAYAPSFFGKTPGNDNAMLTLMSNLMIIIPAGPIQPYGIIGLGLMRPHVNFDAIDLTLNKNAFGYDIGGGLNIFFGHTVGIRGDLRRLKTFENVTLGLFSSDKIDFWRGSAGLTLRF
jgi:outer membrane protein with beta-barrel domain